MCAVCDVRITIITCTCGFLFVHVVIVWVWESGKRRNEFGKRDRGGAVATCCGPSRTNCARGMCLEWGQVISTLSPCLCACKPLSEKFMLIVLLLLKGVHLVYVTDHENQCVCGLPSLMECKGVVSPHNDLLPGQAPRTCGKINIP